MSHHDEFDSKDDWPAIGGKRPARPVHTCIKDDGGTPGRRCDACAAEPKRIEMRVTHGMRSSVGLLVGVQITGAGPLPFTEKQRVDLLKEIQDRLR